MRHARPLRWALALLLVAPLAACGGEREPLVDLQGGLPPVVLIGLDTVRADHLGCYGGPWRTPNIDRLASEGIVFEDMGSTAAWTLPSFASAFTGLYPYRHAAVGGKSKVLSRQAPTLAEFLTNQGYRTTSLVAVDYLSQHFGLHRGFADRRDFSWGDVNERGSRYTQKLDRFLAEPPRGPWLLFTHWFEAHAPYLPPAPFDGMYYEGGDPRDPAGPGLGFLRDPERNRIEARADQLYGWLDGITDPAWPPAQYAAGVSHVDSLVGAVVSRLEAGGLLDEVLLVLWGDHGEHLGEHDVFYTHRFPYQEALHVPFLVRLPGAREAGRRVSTPVSPVDILPTLADLLGLEPEFPVDGTSLVPLMRGDDLPDRVLVAEHGGGEELIRAGWDDRWRLVHHEQDGTAELYDRRADPGETRDVAAQHPEQVRRLMEAIYGQVGLGEAVAAGREGPAATPGPEVEARLRALGYVD